VTVVIAGCAALGLILRGYQLGRPGYLFGVTEYDDGVMFGNALRLVSGSIPYRDFQMVQPPGSMIILAPVALLAKVIGTAQGLAVARVLTVAVDVTNIVLIGVLIRQRGALAVGIASGIYAVYPDALSADHTFMLEPWLNLCCLIAAVLLFDGDRLAGIGRREAPDDLAAPDDLPPPDSPPHHDLTPQGAPPPRSSGTARLAWAGVALGFGAAVKIWAAVPFAIALVIVLAAAFREAPPRPGAKAANLRARLRPAALLTGGAALGLGIPLLPFAIMAPGGLARGVLIGQLARNSGGQRDPLLRLVDLAGLRAVPAKLPGAGTLIAFALVMLACYAGAFLSGRYRRRDSAWLDVYALAGVIAATVMFLWPRLYYSHYGAFAGPFLGLAIALPVGLLVAGLGAPVLAGERVPVGEPVLSGPARGPLVTRATAILAVLVVLGLAGATETQVRALSRLGGVRVASTADRLIPAGACVLTSGVSYTVAANRFFATDPDCPQIVDSFGTLFAMTNGGSVNAPLAQLGPVRQVWQSSLEHAGYVWITDDTTNQVPWDAQLLAYFRAHFRLVGLRATIPLLNPAVPQVGLYRRTWPDGDYK
jgi:alpha-1,2-mannosyltransferase